MAQERARSAVSTEEDFINRETSSPVAVLASPAREEDLDIRTNSYGAEYVCAEYYIRRRILYISPNRAEYNTP